MNWRGLFYFSQLSHISRLQRYLCQRCLPSKQPDWACRALLLMCMALSNSCCHQFLGHLFPNSLAFSFLYYLTCGHTGSSADSWRGLPQPDGILSHSEHFLVFIHSRKLSSHYINFERRHNILQVIGKTKLDSSSHLPCDSHRVKFKQVQQALLSPVTCCTSWEIVIKIPHPLVSFPIFLLGPKFKKQGTYFRLTWFPRTLDTVHTGISRSR